MAQRTDPSTIPDALKNFDSLPDSANVRQPTVEGLYPDAIAAEPMPERIRHQATPEQEAELRALVAAVGNAYAFILVYNGEDTQEQFRVIEGLAN